ncbi:lipoyltransferase [Phanerochaete sordida]|uniref:lipoyl(octanoyl) transferase n=1 Tax=Phanerochaete sordida TaxID=48140 RepID=A0A9P3G5C4_9APHY|nr:lipoyltransferase [Phanerochaete sordida]
MSVLPPIYYHRFRLPLPYVRTLALQEQLQNLQKQRRKEDGSHKDLLLLLEHRPVYTAGRRQRAGDAAVRADEARLTRIGADFVPTQRGGQYTFHGPGQLVGYPLLDLGRTRPPTGIRAYICAMQRALRRHLERAHGLPSLGAGETGVFLDAHTKIASIGVQVRHRLTMHGFSLNITREPLKWFDQVVACGLEDVKAACIAGRSLTQSPDAVTVDGEIAGLVRELGVNFERDMAPLDLKEEPEIAQMIEEVEEEARKAGDWPREPLAQA